MKKDAEMRRALLLSLLFLSGCHGMPLFKALPVSNTAVYAIAGQSNADSLAQQQSENIRQSLGALAIINCAVPSTPMSRWTKDADLYLACVQEIKNTLAIHPGSTLKGIIFWQGEQDATMGTAEMDLWPGRFRAMVDGFREQFWNMPVVFAQITDFQPPNTPYLRTLQDGVFIEGVTMVRTDGIYQTGAHTDNAGYLTMAQRFIEALR